MYENKKNEIPQVLIDKRASQMLGRSFEAGVVFVRQARSRGVTWSKLQELAENSNHQWWNHLNELGPTQSVISISALTIENWKSFFKKYFNIDIDLSNVRVPSGLEHTLYIPEGISINLVVKAHLDRNISFWKYCDADLESVMQKSERGTVKKSYAIRVRNCQEADDDLKNLSAEDIASQNIDTESLLERLIHGLKYYDETAEHLDVKNVTLCASSLCADGSVPFADRNDGGVVYVFWCSPRYHISYLGARRAVRVG